MLPFLGGFRHKVDHDDLRRVIDTRNHAVARETGGNDHLHMFSKAEISFVISVVSGVVFLHEPFSLLQGLATALVLAGIYCVNILHSIYTARRQAAAEQKEQTV